MAPITKATTESISRLPKQALALLEDGLEYYYQKVDALLTTASQLQENASIIGNAALAMLRAAPDLKVSLKSIFGEALLRVPTPATPRSTPTAPRRAPSHAATTTRAGPSTSPTSGAARRPGSRRPAVS
ncbi:hypothetical protein PG984_016218 [Apiospora sp. TS-2023a]